MSISVNTGELTNFADGLWRMLGELESPAAAVLQDGLAASSAAGHAALADVLEEFSRVHHGNVTALQEALSAIRDRLGLNTGAAQVLEQVDRNVANEFQR